MCPPRAGQGLGGNGHISSRGCEDFLMDTHAIGLVLEPRQRQQHDLLELSNVFAFFPCPYLLNKIKQKP